MKYKILRAIRSLLLEVLFTSNEIQSVTQIWTDIFLYWRTEFRCIKMGPSPIQTDKRTKIIN